MLRIFLYLQCVAFHSAVACFKYIYKPHSCRYYSKLNNEQMMHADESALKQTKTHENGTFCKFFKNCDCRMKCNALYVCMWNGWLCDWMWQGIKEIALRDWWWENDSKSGRCQHYMVIAQQEFHYTRIWPVALPWTLCLMLELGCILNYRLALHCSAVCISSHELALKSYAMFNPRAGVKF